VLLPNATRAVVSDAKVREYLLSSLHPIGRFKAAFFRSLGFSEDDWEQLRDALLAIASMDEAFPGQPSTFGQKFEIRAKLVGPSGREAEIVTVWMVTNGQDFPHFVTAHPA
jgi:hypothetical protein